MKGQKVGYIRVSSGDQNPARQVKALEEFKLDKIFTDKLSGKNTDRPEFQNMLDYVREGDCIYVLSMDRLSRKLADLSSTVEKLNNMGVGVFFKKENLLFDPTKNNVMNQLMLNIFGAVAQFERAIIQERVQEGVEIAKLKGKFKGRQNSLNQEQIDNIKKLVDEGCSIAEIARQYQLSRPSIYRYLKL